MQQSIYFSVIVSIVSYVEYILICFFAVYLKIFLYFLLPTLSIYNFFWSSCIKLCQSDLLEVLLHQVLLKCKDFIFVCFPSSKKTTRDTVLLAILLTYCKETR